MDETFRAWIRRNHTREQLEHATKYHHANRNMMDDFVFCCEEFVMEWVAEQCMVVLDEMDEK